MAKIITSSETIISVKLKGHGSNGLTIESAPVFIKIQKAKSIALKVKNVKLLDIVVIKSITRPVNVRSAFVFFTLSAASNCFFVSLWWTVVTKYGVVIFFEKEILGLNL